MHTQPPIPITQTQQVITALTALGADPNAQNTDGATPLHEACRSGDIAAVQALVAAGADKGVVDKEGRRAVDVCAGAGSEALRGLLRGTGAGEGMRKEREEQGVTVDFATAFPLLWPRPQRGWWAMRRQDGSVSVMRTSVCGS